MASHETLFGGIHSLDLFYDSSSCLEWEDFDAAIIQWLLTALRVLFLIYVAITSSSAVLQYHLLSTGS